MAGAAMATRRAWTAWARLFAAIAIFAFLIHKAHLGAEIHIAEQSATLGYLGLGVAVTAAGVVLSAWRWQRVLVALGRPVHLARLVNLYLAGQFVGNFLPTSIGGDALRVSRLSADTGSGATAFASVVLERLTGWVVLPILALTGLFLSPDARDLGTATHAIVAVAVATLTMLVMVLFLAGHPRFAGRFAQRESWTRFIGAVHTGVEQIRRRPSAVLGVLGASFVYQATTVLAFALAIRVVGLHVPMAAVLAFAPIVAIVQVISFLPGGLGSREAALYLFLHPLAHAGGTEATAVGLLFFAMVVAVSLLGAPAFVRNRGVARA